MEEEAESDGVAALRVTVRGVHGDFHGYIHVEDGVARSTISDLERSVNRWLSRGMKPVDALRAALRGGYVRYQIEALGRSGDQRLERED